MGSIHLLAAQARRLNRDAGAPPIPALFFLTDPVRTPDPVAIAERLPTGAAVIFRHFGAPDRAQTARRLANLARRRGLRLLIAADPALARRVGADGVHWPERLLDRGEGRGFALATAAAHGPDAVARAAARGFSACLLGPVFATASASGNPPLGLFRASQIARGAALPVIGLGGIGAETAPRLSGRGFAGVAAVEAFTTL